MTLLQVLVGIARRNFPHIERFLHDLRNIHHAARSKLTKQEKEWPREFITYSFFFEVMASLNDMIQEYNDMREVIRLLDEELETKWRDETELDEGDRFFQVMSEHRDAAKNKFEELETLYVNMDAKWKDAMEYYGETPKSMRPEEFFEHLARFVDNWKV